MNREPTRYKGFGIVAQSYQLVATRRWAVDLEVTCRGRRQTFSVDARYASESEADTKTTTLGRRIIDGAVPGWSVDHLR